MTAEEFLQSREWDEETFRSMTFDRMTQLMKQFSEAKLSDLLSSVEGLPTEDAVKSYFDKRLQQKMINGIQYPDRILGALWMHEHATLALAKQVQKHKDELDGLKERIIYLENEIPDDESI